MEITDLMSIPFVEGGRDENGSDCWGIYLLAMRHLCDKEVPEYNHIAYRGMSNYSETVEKIKKGREDWPFFEVEDEQFGDLILVNLYGRPIHVGFCLGDGTMLHTSQQTGCVIEKYSGVRKWEKRIHGKFRLR